MTFAEKVYDAVSRIPPGRVATYGQIADIIGCPGGSRAVGNALHVNPFAPIVPCHRVVAADGSLAANFGCGGPAVQLARLRAEGVSFIGGAGRGREAAAAKAVAKPAATAQGAPAVPSASPLPHVDLRKCGIVIERHPLEPFLPDNGRILFLGSFPPPKERWSMVFFYPNWINDFWRIQGLIHFNDSHRFEAGGGQPGAARCFDKDRIIAFCREKGLAFYDTASKICRWKGNASDEFLEILEPSDVGYMLSQMPGCRTIVTTGGKSAEELSRILAASGATAATAASPHGHPASASLTVPKVGTYLDIVIAGRAVRWWRMPSSSRAYPMPLSAKAAQYAKLFDFLPQPVSESSEGDTDCDSPEYVK